MDKHDDKRDNEHPDINDPDYAVRIVNEAQRNRDVEKMLANYKNAYMSSTTRTSVDYKPEKRKLRTKFIALAFCSIALVASLALFTKGCDAIKWLTMDESIALTIVDDNKVDDVDEMIAAYQLLMNSTGPNGYRIENSYEYNEKNHESNVDYNPDVLYNLVVDAADVSNVKARCAIIAAYNVINEPYRAEQFNKLFKEIASNQELSATLPKFMTTGSWEGFLNALGYEDVREYNNNERENIKKLPEEIIIPNPRTNR